MLRVVGANMQIEITPTTERARRNVLSWMRAGQVRKHLLPFTIGCYSLHFWRTGILLLILQK